MIQKIKEISGNELIRGSLVLMILLNIGNVLNYIFHFSMANLLGPSDYGVLAVLVNLIYIFSIPTVSVQTLVSSYTTKHNVNKELGKIKGIFFNLLKKTIIISFIIFIIFSFIALVLSKYLQINISLLILTGVFIFVAFISPISIGILQGMKKFKVWGWNYIISNSLKLVLSIILVLIGFKVYGAIIGFIIGTGLGFFLALPFIKEILVSKEIKENVKILSKGSLSIFFAILFVVLLYSIDVIIVKFIFDPISAGKYAVASLIGKIIFFGTSAIGNAMFPISSEKFEKGEKSRTIIKKTFISVFLLCLFAVIILWLFPEQILKILLLKKYLSIGNILVYIGIAFSFVSLLNILILYKISVKKFRFRNVIYLGILVCLQIFILSTLNQSIEIFSIGFMLSSIIIFILSLILFRK